MIKKEHKNLVSIKRACELCEVSRSGYYKWLKRPVKAKVDVLVQKVKRIFKESRKTYGTRRIKKKLAAKGIVVSRQRIRRIMAEQGLVAKARRKTRATTDSNHNHPVAPNLLGGQFDAEHPNEAWVTDITYLATSEGWLDLQPLLLFASPSHLSSRSFCFFPKRLGLTCQLIISTHYLGGQCHTIIIRIIKHLVDRPK